MRPHPNDFDRLDVFQDLIDKAVLDVDPARACPGKGADGLFVRG